MKLTPQLLGQGVGFVHNWIIEYYECREVAMGAYVPGKQRREHRYEAEIPQSKIERDFGGDVSKWLSQHFLKWAADIQTQLKEVGIDKGDELLVDSWPFAMDDHTATRLRRSVGFYAWMEVYVDV